MPRFVGILKQLFSKPVNSKINLSGNFPTNYQAKRTFTAPMDRKGISLPFIEEN